MSLVGTTTFILDQQQMEVILKNWIEDQGLCVDPAVLDFREVEDGWLLKVEEKVDV